MRKILIIITVLIISGCGAYGSVYKDHGLRHKNTGIVYIYRNFDFVGGAGIPNLYINGELKGQLKNDGYLYYELASGNYEFVLGSINNDGANWAPKPVSFRITVNPGEEHYYRMLKDNSEVSMFMVPIGSAIFVGSSGVSKIGIVRLPKNEAIDEISKTQYSK